jgi:hypothetical protein
MSIANFARTAYARLFAPRDAAGLGAFRVGFGLLMTWSFVRFQLYGWVDELYVRPKIFFAYWGFEWLPRLSASAIHGMHVVMTVLAILVALGLFYRAAIVTFTIGFWYLQLLDVTNYLNHYYLVALLSTLMCFLPMHRSASIDARLRPRLRSSHAPAWTYLLLRFQVGTVYFFAGLAKLGADWLLHAQPLRIWLTARTGLPVIGPLLAQAWAPHLFAWAGFLFDTTIVAFLLWRRTRLAAYVVVLVFHVMTHVLFPIGMFPFIMIVGALVFFPPEWPRRIFARAAPLAPILAPARVPPSTARVRIAIALGAAYCAFQALFPLRHHLYGANLMWHEQGIRWSWKVMVREKNGSVTYYVDSPGRGRTWQVSPSAYLTDRQLRDFSSQPDLIAQLGQFIADDWRKRGIPDARVRVEALVSLNGRRASLLVDPTLDVASMRDGLAPKPWILPAPASDPPVVRLAHAN